MLNDAVHDRFVSGIHHELIQHRLWSEKDLTYKRVIEIPVLWKLPTPMQSPSRTPVQLLEGLSVNQTEAKMQGIHATAADAPHNSPQIVNSSRRRATTVGRKAIYHRCAIPKLNSYNHPQGHLSLRYRTHMDETSSTSRARNRVHHV